MKWLLWQCIGPWLLAALPAQGRAPLYGAVWHLDGRAAAAAAVTLVHQPPGGPAGGPADVVAAVADARGRFVARLLPQCDYSAHAVLPAADGTFTASPVREGACAGIECELRLGLPQRPPRVQLAGAEAWASLGPLAVELAPEAAHLHFTALVDGAAPPLPDWRRILVRTAAGEPLWLGPVPEAKGGVLEAHLPPPLDVWLRAVDANGQALAAVEVLAAAAADPFAQPTGAWFGRPALRLDRRVGCTDAEGRCRLQVPRPAAGVTSVALRAAGRAEAVVAVDTTGRISGEGVVVPAAVAQAVDVPLLPAARLRLCAGDQAVVPAAALLTTCGRGPHSIERTAALHFDAAGTCVLPLPPDPVESMLHVQERVGGPWRLQRVAFHSGATAVVDLAAQRQLTVRCTGPDGAPARGLVGVLVAVSSHRALLQQVVVCTDQAGRLERWLGPDAWVLVLTDGRSWGSTLVPRYDAPRGRGEQVRDVVLAELPSVRLVFTDSRGLPVLGVRAAVFSGGVGNGPGTEEIQVARVLGQLVPALASGQRSDLYGALWLPLLAGAKQHILHIEHPEFPRAQLRVSPGDDLEFGLGPRLVR
jgi:hypothetical protein